MTTAKNHLHSALEILGVIMPLFFCTFIFTSLTTSRFKSATLKTRLALEYMAIMSPIIFIMTVCAPYVLAINTVLIAACLLVHVIDGKRKTASDKFVLREDAGQAKPFITNVRSTINALTVVAILAVDFKPFPGRFHKTERYGFSLMDIGVGVYVFANGIVAPEIRGHANTMKKTVLGVLPLLVIGIGRFILTKWVHYHVAVTEYGLHWNFFITLAVTRLVSVLIMSAAPCNAAVCAFEGFVLLTIHQILLNVHLEEYVFSKAPRENFIDANREGIISSLGYIGLYFLSVAFGFIINAKTKLKLHIQLIAATTITGLITYILHENFNISRRLANSTYCMWILFVGILVTSLYYATQEFQKYLYANCRVIVSSPFMFDAINYNGLTFFLVANVLTGLINLSIKTQKVNVPGAILILIVYLLGCCLICCFLYVKKWKLKI